MNNYIKHIVEAFDFGSVKKDDRSKQLANTAISIAAEYINKIVNDKILMGIKPSDEDIKLLYSQTGFYKVKNKTALRKLIKNCIKIFGNDCNLNWFDVSNITNMSNIFKESVFNGDISQWDVSNVKDMNEMFKDSQFNNDISTWNVSKVTDMSYMFQYSKFNGDISNWNVSNVIDIDNIFKNCHIKDKYKPKFKKK